MSAEHVVKQVDLSADVGEDFLNDEGLVDRLLLPLLTSCHLSCGAHSGTSSTICQAIEIAIEHGVAIGAHPAYPDRVHGGRRTLNLPVPQLLDSLTTQILQLKDRIETAGAQLRHVKPHGALYHDLMLNPDLAYQFAESLVAIDAQLAWYGMAGSQLADVAHSTGLKFVHEVFIDRGYEQRTQLTPRTQPSALLTTQDQITRQIEGFLSGQVIDRYHQVHHIPVDSMCLHSDAPHAVRNLQIARELLKARCVTLHSPQ